VVAPPPPGPSITCQNCGEFNAVDRTYCQRCGEQLAGQRQQPQPAQYLPPPPQQQHGPFPAKIVLTVVLALALIVAGVVFVLSRGGDKEPTAGASNQPSKQATVTTQPTSTVAEKSTSVETSSSAAPRPAKVDRSTMTARASSTLPPNQQLGRSYNIENVLDSNLQTAWNSDGDKVGTGVGVMLTFRFAKPTHLIRLDFVNGYARNTQLYKENGRVHGLQITTDSGSVNLELADRPIVQSLNHDFGTTSSVSITVTSVYPGNQFKDLALTEVGFLELR
jgi:cytoskeletal protein RodZ